MKKSRLKLVVVTLLILFILAYNYIYKEHRNIAQEEPEHLVSAQLLFDTYQKNDKKADNLYLNKTVQITGVITSKSGNEIVIDKTITCYFDNPVEYTFKPNQEISIKGRLIGFDNLLEEIKLDQCSIIN